MTSLISEKKVEIITTGQSVIQKIENLFPKVKKYVKRPEKNLVINLLFLVLRLTRLFNSGVFFLRNVFLHERSGTENGSYESHH